MHKTSLVELGEYSVNESPGTVVGSGTLQIVLTRVQVVFNVHPGQKHDA